MPTRIRRAWMAAAALVLLAAAPAAHAATTRSVVAGQLVATVSADPWGLTFTDIQPGGPELTEFPAGGNSPSGRLGFYDGTAWRHATRVVSERNDGESYVALLATEDPLGRQIDVRVSPRRDGVIAVRASVTGGGSVSATGIAFRAMPNERYLGFGERSNGVDQRGRVVDNFVADGPYQPEERPFIAAFVPPQGFGDRDDSTYFPMPWLLSTRGYGVLLDNDERSRFRLGTDRADAWSVDVDARELHFRVFAGPKPADVVDRMSETVGRQPPAAAPWFFGPWFQPRGDEAANIAALRKADAPASVMQTYTHYLPCGDQRGAEAAQRRRTERAHAAGLAVTTYFNPMVCTDYQPVYDEAVAAGVLTKDSLGRPYQYRYTGASQFLVSQFDFSAPGASAFYGRLLGEAVSHGYDGWMEDFGEYTPGDARSANGMPGPAMHNLYPVLYHGAAHAYAKAAPRPLARFNRSGWTGAARESQIVWGGDPTTDWGFDGLASAVKQGLTMGLSGVSLWGSAIGGFFSLGSRELTPELLARWIEVGFASGVMRTEANGFAVPEKPRPQIFDAATLPVWRRYAKLRTQLYPYLAAADRRYQETGIPIMSHLALAYPEDPRASAREDEYLFGRDILAAPVLSDGARQRRLYLPRGRWVDLWRSARFDGASGALALGGARVLEGAREVTVPAPLEELPLFVRAGAVLPLLAPDVQTLTAYGSGVVHLSDRRRDMRLLAFPRGTRKTSVGPGETLLSLEGRRRGWRLKLTGRLRRTYRLQASLATLRRPYRPCAIRVRGRRLSRTAWSYDAQTEVLRARFKIKSGTVAVARRCRR